MTTAEHDTHAGPTARPDPRTHPSAAAWLDDETAIVARIDERGTVSTCTVDRGSLARIAYLAVVAGAIGNRRRVAILGPRDARLALEREYATIYRRPDRLLDVEAGGPFDEAALVTRVRGLAG
jgi:hypothetical protein